MGKRKSRKKKVEVALVEADEPVDVYEGRPVVSLPEEEPAVEEISGKAKLITLLQRMPEVPPLTDKEFTRKYLADYVPQIASWKQALRGLAEQL